MCPCQNAHVDGRHSSRWWGQFRRASSPSNPQRFRSRVYPQRNCCSRPPPSSLASANPTSPYILSPTVSHFLGADPCSVSARHPLDPSRLPLQIDKSASSLRPMARLHLPEPSSGTKQANSDDVLRTSRRWLRGGCMPLRQGQGRANNLDSRTHCQGCVDLDPLICFCDSPAGTCSAYCSCIPEILINCAVLIFLQ